MARVSLAMPSSGHLCCIASYLVCSHSDMTKRILLVLSLLQQPAPAARLKDLVAIEGVRDNQLLGYGLTVGLAGTGDRRQTLFSAQSLTNMLERMGLSVSPTLIQIKNTAAVMVTATLPPFAQPGSRIDVTVSA